MKYYLQAMVVPLMAGLFIANAAAVEVDITGTVLAFPCEVDPGSANKSVELGNISVSGLSEQNSSHTWKAFDIKVINCPAGLGTLTATFTGEASGSANNLYANKGTAQNVAVQMAQLADTNHIQGSGSSMTVNVESDHSATFKLVGRPYSENGSATVGTLNSMVQVNFSYP